MRRSGRTAKKTATDFEQLDFSLQGVIGKRALMVGAAAGLVTALGRMVKTAADAGDKMFDLSRRFGVSVETMSRLKFVAEQSGASVDQLGIAFRAVSRRAAISTMEFEKWGVKTKTATGGLKDSESLFFAAVKRINELGSGAEKTAAAMDIFGDAGANLLQVVHLGEDGIRELMERADELGITMSTEAAVAANQFNNSLGELGNTVTRAKDDAFVESLPVLEAYTRKLIELTAATKEAKAENAVFATILGGLKTAINLPWEAAGKLAKELGWMDEVQAQAAETTRKLREQQQQAAGTFASVTDKVRQQKDALKQLQAEAKLDFTGMSGQLGADLDALLADFNSIADENTRIFKHAWATAINDVAGLEAARYERAAEDAIRYAEQQEEIQNRNRQAAAQAAQGVSAAWETAFTNIITGQQSASEAIIQAVIHSAEVAVQAAAASGAAQAAFSQAGIPILGPALAVATSALIFGLIRGFLAEIPKAATGGLITGGTPGTDSVPMMTMPGERILSVEDNHRLIRAVERSQGHDTFVINAAMFPTDAAMMRSIRHFNKQQRRARSRGH
jgi:hypothetical protein